MPDLTFAPGDSMGGCVLPSAGAPNGDPATWCPAVWDWLIRSVGASSVLDVGCGAGFATRYFRAAGLEARGIEGSPEAIAVAVAPGIIRHDFRDGPRRMERMYDLGWCAEVVEHIDPEFEYHLLETLGACRVVAITHGFPGQGGHHHVNLQYPSYWIDRMRGVGFYLDVRLTQQCRLVARQEAAGADSHFARSGLVFHREAPAPVVGDVLLTWASGPACLSPEVGVFLASLPQHFAGARVAFTHDMDLDAREAFEAAGFTIHDINPNHVGWLVRDRFRVYHTWLEGSTGLATIFLVDSRDMLFQGDFAGWVRQRVQGHEEFLVLAGEGHPHRRSPWNTRDQGLLQLRVPARESADWEVVNGGFQAGSLAMILRLCEEVYALSDGIGDCRPTDQACLNYLCRGWREQGLPVHLADPDDSPLILHGEPLQTGARPTPDYRDYHVFHQWDRTEFKAKILAQYGD